jgi:hypothetical protein
MQVRWVVQFLERTGWWKCDGVGNATDLHKGGKEGLVTAVVLDSGIVLQPWMVTSP